MRNDVGVSGSPVRQSHNCRARYCIFRAEVTRRAAHSAIRNPLGTAERAVAGQSEIRNSFTLVELLVVVSIIALLIAILLPSLRKAREQAKLVACMANMGGLGKASMTYAAEDPSENIIPIPPLEALPAAPGNFEWGGKAGAGQPTQPNDPTYSLWGTANYRGPAHRPLNRYIYKAGFKDYNPVNGNAQPGAARVNYLSDTKVDLPVFRCPSDSGYAGGGYFYKGGRHREYSEEPFATDLSALSAYDYYGNSYVANTFWSAYGGYEGFRMFSQSPYLQPHSRIPAPANTLLYMEIPARCAWLWGDWSDISCAWAQRPMFVEGHFKTIRGWHRRDFGFVAAFCDGHAAMVEMKGCQRPPPHLGISNYPAGTCGNTDPYSCLRCITVRGPGWQLDTLPAPGIPTNWYN